MNISPEQIIDDLSQKLNRQNLDAWEIYIICQQGVSVEVKEQKLENFNRWQDCSLALRVIKNKRLGFGYCTELNEKSLNKLFKNIVENLMELDEDPWLILPEDPSPAYQPKEIFDPNFSQITDAERFKKALLMEKSARELDDRIRRVRSCEYQEEVSRVWIKNSLGIDKSAQSTMFSAHIMAVAEENSDAQIASEFDWCWQYDKLNCEEIGKRAGKKALSKLGARMIPNQKIPAVFTSEVAGEFVELLSYAFSAENLSKNKSWLKDSLGKKIFSEKINIIDDGLFVSGPECFPFDDEGVNTQKTVLVENGVVRQFLYDCYYASKAKTCSTGNAQREAISQPPSVSPTNFYIVPAKKSLDELIKLVDKGILISEVLGMHTADEISGEFSLGINGHMIEKGEISFPVRGVAIAGSVKELFSRVAELGGDLRFYQACASPSLLIEELEISGS